MKVKELIAQLLDEDQEAEALIIHHAEEFDVIFEATKVAGKSGDCDGVVILADLQELP